VPHLLYFSNDENTLSIRIKVLGSEHPDAAATYNKLAGQYYIQGDCDKAMKLLHKATAIFDKNLGTEHPLTLATYERLFLIYERLGCMLIQAKSAQKTWNEKSQQSTSDYKNTNR